MLDDRLALSVTSSSGRVTRWGGDEPNAEMIPGDLQFSTSIPGGYKDLSCSLLRRTGGTESLFDRVRAYGPGNRTAWDGRLVQFPRDDLRVNPSAVGWSGHMRDDTSFRETYIDRELGSFIQASPARRLAALSGQDFQDFRLASDPNTATSAMNIGLIGAWSRLTACEAFLYGSPGGKLARLKFDFSSSTSTVAAASASWNGLAYSTNRAQTSFTSVLDWQGTANTGSADYNIGLPGAEGFMLQWYYDTGPAGGDQTNYDMFITNMRAIGAHGLTLQGATATEEGFYGHDLMYDIVTRAAPLLTTSIATGQIETNTTFIVPQLTFSDPTTAEQAVMMLNAYFLWEWGVYDNKQFFWRPPDASRLTWRARADQGASISLEGETADARYNGVLVQYTDPLGERRTAGPPAENWQGGVARCDVTNVALVDTDPTNPVNAAGIPRRWGVLDVGPTTTDAGAVQLGAVWLAEHRLPQRRGTITLRGSAGHPTEGQVPPWRVRAGDGIVVTDLADDEPRRIIETRYTRGDDSLVATVGNPDYKIDAILERLRVQLIGTV
jgi:hypothetical protein